MVGNLFQQQASGKKPRDEPRLPVDAGVCGAWRRLAADAAQAIPVPAERLRDVPAMVASGRVRDHVRPRARVGEPVEPTACRNRHAAARDVVARAPRIPTRSEDRGVTANAGLRRAATGAVSDAGWARPVGFAAQAGPATSAHATRHARTQARRRVGRPRKASGKGKRERNGRCVGLSLNQDGPRRGHATRSGTSKGRAAVARHGAPSRAWQFRAGAPVGAPRGSAPIPLFGRDARRDHLAACAATHQRNTARLTAAAAP